MSTYVVGEDRATLDEKKNVVRLLKAFVISNRLSCRKMEKQPGKPGFGELEELLTNTESMTLRQREKNFPMSILQVRTHPATHLATPLSLLHSLAYPTVLLGLAVDRTGPEQVQREASLWARTRQYGGRGVRS